MAGHWFGLIELLLVFGLVLGWAAWQWWDWRRWRRRQRRDDKPREQAQRKRPVAGREE